MSASDSGSGLLAQKGKFSKALIVSKKHSSQWIIDSGASDHMTGDATLLNEYNQCTNNSTVRIANGSSSQVKGISLSRLLRDMILNSILYVPNLDCNLLSISKLTRDLNCVAKFFPHLCIFQDLDTGKKIGSAKMCSGLYLLKSEISLRQTQNRSYVSSNGQSALNFHVNKDSEVLLWHYRLGHPNFIYLEKLFPSFFSNKSSKSFKCEICQLSKHVHSSYPTISYKPSNPFAMIHSDVWGPSQVHNITGTRWFVSFVDDHTRLTWLFLMKEKSKVSQIFQNFHAMIQTQFQTKIQILKTDNAKEYFNSSLNTYCLNQGIIHVSYYVNTSQQNRVAEMKNIHLLEVVRSLTLSTHVPKQLWGEAVLTTTYLINRMPSRVLNFRTPSQVLLQAFPYTKLLSSLDPKVFGCSVFVHIHHRGKLDPTSLKCIFIGYSPHQKGYKCYYIVLKKVYTSMNVTFFEHQAYYPKSDL